jgi:hypothetical protein
VVSAWRGNSPRFRNEVVSRGTRTELINYFQKVDGKGRAESVGKV